MSTRKTSLFYGVLIAVAGMAVGLVIASRLDLAPPSSAQTVNVPSMNSAPLTGAIDATTFRNIAKVNAPAVVNIQTEVRQRGRDLTGHPRRRRHILGNDAGRPRNVMHHVARKGAEIGVIAAARPGSDRLWDQ